MLLQSRPANLGSPVFETGGWFNNSWTAACDKEGCRCDLGECLIFSAKLDRWLIVPFPGAGLPVFFLEGGSNDNECSILGVGGADITSVLGGVERI
jgi:hypothetical protein